MIGKLSRLTRPPYAPLHASGAHLLFAGFFKSLGTGRGRARRSRDLEPPSYGETEQEGQQQRYNRLQDSQQARCGAPAGPKGLEV